MLVKERFKKSYRHPILDERITTRRVVQEARSLERCRKLGVNVPILYSVNVQKSKIYMEEIVAVSLKEYIYALKDDCFSVLESLATQLAKIHSSDLIHGDLTSSNILVNDKVYLIDFGLSYVSNLPEDKAVDLYVLERAFKSTHPNHMNLFDTILSIYFERVSNSKQIEHKLEEVRLRGRKQSMIG